MWETRIEEAAKAFDGVKTANWDQETKMLNVTYDTDKTKEKRIHEAIAGAGHDTEKVTAPREVYENLPACCQYPRNKE